MDKTRTFGHMAVVQLKAELKKRGAGLNGCKSVLLERLEAYDRNNNFVDNDSNSKENDNIPNLLFPWPDDASYRSVSAHSKVPNLNSVYINVYYLRQYSSGVGLSEFEAVNSLGFTMSREFFLASLTESTDEANSVVFYQGQVNSEMTKALTYFVKVCVQFEGSIVQSECECGAGKGPIAVCKHVAVVCYTVEHFKEAQEWLIRKTVTQKKQSWHAPKNIRLNVSPKKAQDLKVTAQKPGREVKEKLSLCFDPRTATSPAVDYNARARSAILNYTNFAHRSLGISTIFQVASTKAILNDHEYIASPFHHQQVYNRIKVTQEQADKIEELSRKQANSKVWWKEKEIRVTASKVGEICHFTDRRDQETYAQGLVDSSKKHINTEAVLHGRINEAKAVKSVEKDSHNRVRKCGLFISVENPFLAASPDGLVAVVSLLEVKCPFSIKDELATPENYSHLKYRNGEICLKMTSNYFYQVQTQLYCAKKDYCFFYVWTNCGGTTVHVERDDAFISDKIIPKVKKFFDSFMVPEIQKKIYPLV